MMVNNMLTLTSPLSFLSHIVLLEIASPPPRLEHPILLDTKTLKIVTGFPWVNLEFHLIIQSMCHYFRIVNNVKKVNFGKSYFFIPKILLYGVSFGRNMVVSSK